MNKPFESLLVILMIVPALLWAIGIIYWQWMAVQIGSFLMFFIGLFPPFLLLTGPIGGWSFLFGPPDWLINFFR